MKTFRPNKMSVELEVPEVGVPPIEIPPYQGNPQLFINSGTNYLLYRIGNQWLDASTLQPNQIPISMMQPRYLMNIVPSNYHSQPVYVQFTDEEWEVLATDRDRLIVQSFQSNPIEEYIDPGVDEVVDFVQPFLIPNVNLPPFNEVWMNRLVDLANNDLPISDIDLSPISPLPGPVMERAVSTLNEQGPSIRSLGFGQVGQYSSTFNEQGQPIGSIQPRRTLPTFNERAEREIQTEENSLDRRSIEMLMRQLYGLPVVLPEKLEVNQLQVPFISFNRAVELIQGGQVQSFTLNPLLQSWAGLPSSPNRIITLILNNGTTVLVRANYDHNTNNILPPV